MLGRTFALLALTSLALLACEANDEPTSTAPPVEPQPASAAPADPEPVSPFTEYQRKSMRSEAMLNGRMLTDLIRSRFVADGTKPSSIPATPAPGSCCKQPEGLCATNMGSWDDPAWKALEFRPRDPHRYSYQIDVEGDAVTVTASADLDCDGTLSTYAYKGTITADDIEWNTDEPVETNPLD